MGIKPPHGKAIPKLEMSRAHSLSQGLTIGIITVHICRLSEWLVVGDQSTIDNLQDLLTVRNVPTVKPIVNVFHDWSKYEGIHMIWQY